MLDQSARVDLVESTHFSTQELPVSDRYALWRDSISTLFDVKADPRAVSDNFSATIDSVLLNDQVMFARCQTKGQHFERSPLKTATDGLDYYLVQTHLSGCQGVRRGSKERTAEVGDLMVMDLADVHYTDASDFTNLTLIIPRYLLAPMLSSPDSQEGRVLKADCPLAMMAVQHMIVLEKISPQMTKSEAAHCIQPTLTLLASALNGTPERVEGGASSVARATLIRAQTEIEARLGQGDLAVTDVCAVVGLSRASLYRLFQPFGGLKAYIQERRLRRCAQDLINPSCADRKIYDIAYSWGFNSESHFSRAFKARFGVTPREARYDAAPIKSAAKVPNSSSGIDRMYEHWISTVLRT